MKTPATWQRSVSAVWAKKKNTEKYAHLLKNVHLVNTSSYCIWELLQFLVIVLFLIFSIFVIRTLNTCMCLATVKKNSFKSSKTVCNIHSSLIKSIFLKILNKTVWLWVASSLKCGQTTAARKTIIKTCNEELHAIWLNFWKKLRPIMFILGLELPQFLKPSFFIMN